MRIKDYSVKTLLIMLASLATHSSFANQPSYTYPANSVKGNFVFQLGGFIAHQGSSQNIDIEELIGDRFVTVTNHNDGNVLLGLGYLIDGPCTYTRFHTMFGINAFYLPQTFVKGNVIQEHLFTNLSYKYSVTNLPIYLSEKTLFKTNSEAYDITLDLGVGANIKRMRDFKEKSLDGGITEPDHIFSSHTETVLSATVGVGIQFNNLLRNIPFECGYRFFYLGSGHFEAATHLTSSLRTGDNYANAVMCSVMV